MYNDRKVKTLEAKIRAYNRAAEKAIAIHAEFSAALAPFVGKQVLKKDGSLLEKVKALLPKTENTPDLMIYKNSSNYTLAWTLKACENVANEDVCEYQEVTAYVADLQDGVLTRIYPSPSLRHDFTIGEILAKRETLAIAKKNLEDAKSALYPFDE